MVIESVLLYSCAVAQDGSDRNPTGGSSGCQMADLFLRSAADADGNAQPIDVRPVAGALNSYVATMDYRMQGFNLEARAVPSEFCRVAQGTTSTTLVDAGSYFVAEVAVEDLQYSGQADRYHVNVSRLLGTETTLASLEVKDAYLVPSFDPNVRNYSVYLDVRQDLVRCKFQRIDNGELVTLSAQLEAPQVSAVRRLQNGPVFGPGISEVNDGLGPPIGEVQGAPSTLLTAIDVGNRRVVDLLVTSADISAHGRYRLDVQRPFCQPDRRFFDGKAQVCTDICNEGYFGNPATGRCTACVVANCASCDSGNACAVCLDGFSLQDGQCAQGGAPSGVQMVQQVGGAMGGAAVSAERYAARHRMLALGGGVVASIAFCACMALLCCQQRGFRRAARLLDSDDDDFDKDFYGPVGESYS